MSRVIYQEEETFLHWINAKYRKIMKWHPKDNRFREFDDYAIFLWFDYCKKDDEKYYEMLETDFREYSEKQQIYIKEVEKGDISTPKESGKSNDGEEDSRISTGKSSS